MRPGPCGAGVIHRGTGILVANQPYIDVSITSHDVVEAAITESGITYMLARTTMPCNPFGIVARPESFMMVGARMQLWPTPDKAYALHMSWNTDITWPVGWYAGYEAALKAAYRARDLATTGMHVGGRA